MTGRLLFENMSVCVYIGTYIRVYACTYGPDTYGLDAYGCDTYGLDTCGIDTRVFTGGQISNMRWDICIT